MRRYWTERPDRELLEALALKADGFTPEGRAVLEEERKRRKITQEQVEGFRKAHARPEPDLSPEAELVTVARFQHPYQANIARSFLEDNGVSAFVAEEHITSMNWLYTQAVGKPRLQVRRSDAKQAYEILSAPADRQGCLNCDSEDVREVNRELRDNSIWFVAAFAVLIFLSCWFDFLIACLALFQALAILLLPFFRRHLACRVCGHRWS